MLIGGLGAKYAKKKGASDTNRGGVGGVKYLAPKNILGAFGFSNLKRISLMAAASVLLPEA